MDNSHIDLPIKFNVDELKQYIVYNLKCNLGKDPAIASTHDWLNTTLFVVRDCLVERWLHTHRAQLLQKTRQVYYLSMEFLIGRTLSNALLSLGIYDDLKDALESMGLTLEELIDEESDPGLGNGGLGRLAACFLDSLASLSLPVRGYGIRYRCGMFKQSIVDGQQKESPDNWLEYGNPWEFKRHDTCYKVCFGGRIQEEGNNIHWIETEEILAVAYDQIIPGYDTYATNTLRLWDAQARNEINLGKFNQGDYFAAMEGKNFSENVSQVLYPDDSSSSGYELRLHQEYFLVSATMQDILNHHYQLYKTYDNLAEKIAIHLNDTHPVLSIPELMHQLIDEHKFSWDDAFEVCCQVFSYTNHTLMSEALESWSIDILSKILPRHLQIIVEINDYFLKTLQEQYPDDIDLFKRVSIINGPTKDHVRMAWLAVVVCHKVNGISDLHSALMVKSLFADFAMIFPTRFCNVTNGVTPRRWLALANPPLSEVLDNSIGHTWRTDLSQLRQLEQHYDFPLINLAVQQAKLENKKRLALWIAHHLNVVVNPKALFDVQIKRIHEYKRQLMNLLHVITRYNRIKADPEAEWIPRVIIFAGKAASAYYMAKHIIHLINDVAKVINNDPMIGDKLKVVFIPNYSVTLAQTIIPATNLSEQISLAGTEASGTSNMKFALNGALTIGTLDGANVEILEHVGVDNIFIFGNTANEVETLRRQGYMPRGYYENDEELNQVLTQIGRGEFSKDEPGRYRDLVDSLINFGDHYQILADYRSYIDCQDKVDELYRTPEEWTTKSMINIANMGHFSSDRAVKEYAEKIWNLKPMKI